MHGLISSHVFQTLKINKQKPVIEKKLWQSWKIWSYHLPKAFVGFPLPPAKRRQTQK
jgi:hypothetical protein